MLFYSGDLMLFTPSAIQPKGDQPVTAKELLFLTEGWVRLRKASKIYANPFIAYVPCHVV